MPVKQFSLDRILFQMARKRRHQRDRRIRQDGQLVAPAAPVAPTLDRPTPAKRTPEGALWDQQCPAENKNLVVGNVSENFILDKVEEEDDDSDPTPLPIRVCDSLREHIDWWRNLPNDVCPRSVLQIIEKGIFIKLDKNISTNYREKNNKSCIDNMSFARQATEKWLQSGAVERTTLEKLSACNPMTVAINRRGFRLCIDMSRHVNVHTPKRPFKLLEMRRFAATVKPSDFMFGFDLKVITLAITIVSSTILFFRAPTTTSTTGSAVGLG